jgi:hypothetical protein
MVTTTSPSNQKNRELSQYVKLVVPGDQSRYEDVLTLSFPSGGRGSADIFLENGTGSWPWVTTYEFDVTRAITDIVSPLECIPEGRQIAPLELPDDLSMTPNNSAIVSNFLTFDFKASYFGIILFHLRRFGGSKTIIPTDLGTVQQGNRRTGTYRCTVPAPGIYNLMISRGNECHKQVYALKVPRRRVRWTKSVHNSHNAASDDETSQETGSDSQEFVQIQPRGGLVKADSGFALIRFAVASIWSKLRVAVTGPDNQQHDNLSHYVKLAIPPDESRCEYVVVISFPTVGRWTVTVWLENEAGSCGFLTTHRFDVAHGIEEKVSPLECIPEDRHGVPLELPRGLSIAPNHSAIVSNSLTFEIEASYVGNVWFTLRRFGENKSICPSDPSEIEEDRNSGKLRFSVSKPGIYRLCIWLDGACYEQLYSLGVPRRTVEWLTPGMGAGPVSAPVSPSRPMREGRKAAKAETALAGGKNSKCCLLL